MYLREFRRILHEEGKLYLSVFAEAGVPTEEENPDGYIPGLKPRGPLHWVRINRHYFESMIHKEGLRVDAFCAKVMGQATYLLSRSPTS